MQQISCTKKGERLMKHIGLLAHTHGDCGLGHYEAGTTTNFGGSPNEHMAITTENTAFPFEQARHPRLQ